MKDMQIPVLGHSNHATLNSWITDWVVRMGFLAFLFCCWFIWFLIQLSINDLKEQKKASRSKTNTKQNLNTQKTESPRSSRSQDYRNGMRIPTEDCICGCNGVPLTELPDYSIDYERYKVCPARWRRKKNRTIHQWFW